MTTLSTAETADTLGVSAVRVRQMLHRGELTGALEQRRGRAVWRVDPDSVGTVLAARQAQGRSTLTLASLDERLARVEADTTSEGRPWPASAGGAGIGGPGVVTR